MTPTYVDAAFLRQLARIRRRRITSGATADSLRVGSTLFVAPKDLDPALIPPRATEATLTIPEQREGGELG